MLSGEKENDSLSPLERPGVNSGGQDLASERTQKLFGKASASWSVQKAGRLRNTTSYWSIFVSNSPAGINYLDFSRERGAFLESLAFLRVRSQVGPLEDAQCVLFNDRPSLSRGLSIQKSRSLILGQKSRPPLGERTVGQLVCAKWLTHEDTDHRGADYTFKCVRGNLIGELFASTGRFVFFYQRRAY